MFDFLYSDYLDMWHHAHLMDAMAGTHLVPPSYSLPTAESEPTYAPEVRGWLEEYEKAYGPRGTSSKTTEQVPLEWTCGTVRVIDVHSLIGSTNQDSWPASPEVTPAWIKNFESRTGQLRSGEVVLLYTGHVDKFYKAPPASDGLWTDPLKIQNCHGGPGRAIAFKVNEK